MNLEIPDPKKGAAYRVLYERFAPTFIGSQEQRDQLSADFGRVMAWAQEQPRDVFEAYSWAIKSILGSVDQRLAQSRLATKVAQEFNDIPRPPE